MKTKTFIFDGPAAIEVSSVAKCKVVMLKSSRAKFADTLTPREARRVATALRKAADEALLPAT